MVLSALLCLKAFALDINDRLPNVRLLALYPNNIVVLNRSVGCRTRHPSDIHCARG